MPESRLRLCLKNSKSHGSCNNIQRCPGAGQTQKGVEHPLPVSVTFFLQKKKVTKEKLSLYYHDDDSETLRQDGAIKSRAVAARLLSRRTRRTALASTADSAQTEPLRDDQCQFAFGKLLTLNQHSIFTLVGGFCCNSSSNKQ